jgi:hypothetical protein
VFLHVRRQARKGFFGLGGEALDVKVRQPWEIVSTLA